MRAFPVEATHDEQFHFLGSDAEQALREHLAGKALAVTRAALAESVPGSKGP